MGSVYPGIPKQLTLNLRDQFSIKSFVETGTYRADSALWASEHFEKVFTIEASTFYWLRARIKYFFKTNISFLYGLSKKQLDGIIASLKEPAIFWLDAHWSAGTTYGEEYECALVDEIKIINRSAMHHILLIDDARYFLQPPPPPHDPTAWPSITEITRLLTGENHSRVVKVIDDVIVAIPSEGRDISLAVDTKEKVLR